MRRKKDDVNKKDKPVPGISLGSIGDMLRHTRNKNKVLYNLNELVNAGK